MATTMASTRHRIFDNGDENDNVAYYPSNGYECSCCPYGYHIDLEFVKFCENLEQARNRSIDEEKRRRRARRKQCQSMEFLLGIQEIPDTTPEVKPIPRHMQPGWGEILDNFEATLSSYGNLKSPGPVRCQEREQEQTESISNGITPKEPSLQSIREQMATALERMKLLEEQVKEIPTLQVQIAVLKEERRILLRQLSSQKRLCNSKRDVGTSCTVITRDIGVCHQQIKTRDVGISVIPLAKDLRTTGTETSTNGSSWNQMSTGTQCKIEEAIKKPEKIFTPIVLKRNKEVQATEAYKVRLNVGSMAKPSTTEVATETINSYSLNNGQSSVLTKSIGVGSDRIKCISRSTDTRPWAPKTRDFGTSPPRKTFVDVSVGGSLPTNFSDYTNYCDGCKPISKTLVKRIEDTKEVEIDIPEKIHPLKRHDTWTKIYFPEDSNKYDNRLQSSDNNKDDCVNESNTENKFNHIDDGVSTTSTSSNEHEEEEEIELSTRVEDLVAANEEAPKAPMIEMSKEMKAALKVLDDNLKKCSSNILPSRFNNASRIVQFEWFKVSSVASADPLSVEHYLDQFEQFSSSLLGHIVNLTDSSGNTAMHYAVSHGNFDVVSILLDSKECDVNKANNAGYTPVMLAALANVKCSTHASVAGRLFQMSDVNIRAKLHGQTALMLAVSHGRRDMTQLLLDAGAAVNVQDEDGSTALMCAAEHGHADIVKLLLAHPDCDSIITDVDGSSALKIALEAGHANIGVLLYSHQRINKTSPTGSFSSVTQRNNKKQKIGVPSQAVSSSAPVSPVIDGNRRKFHSSSLSLMESSKYCT